MLAISPDGLRSILEAGAAPASTALATQGLLLAGKLFPALADS